MDQPPHVRRQLHTNGWVDFIVPSRCKRPDSGSVSTELCLPGVLSAWRLRVVSVFTLVISLFRDSSSLPASEDMQGNTIAQHSVVVAKAFDSQPKDAVVFPPTYRRPSERCVTSIRPLTTTQMYLDSPRAAWGKSARYICLGITD